MILRVNDAGKPAQQKETAMLWQCDVCGWINIGERPCTAFEIMPIEHMILAGSVGKANTEARG